MSTKSATPTTTPVVRPKTHLNEAVTWTRDWFNCHEYTKNGNPQTKMKGWMKKRESSETFGVAPGDVLNIGAYKYAETSVVEDQVEDVQPRASSNDADLKLGFSMDKKDDQISSLSGLGM